MTSSEHRLLIFGCGFLGRRVARRWSQQVGPVYAVTRSSDRTAEWAPDGITPVVANVMSPETLRHLPSVSHVLHCVGFDRQSTVSKQAVYVDGLAHVLDHLPETVRRFVYVSSSSVYGQDAGEWVDEYSPTEPHSEGGMICLQAERLLHEKLSPATILRMSGLYGPERLLARIDALQRGEPIGGNPDSWLNLIHGDDAARACIATLTAPSPAPIYLVSDNRPILRSEYFSELAKRVGAPTPQFGGQPTRRHSSGGLNKRCCSELIQRDLSLTWTHPDIQSGLSTAIESSSHLP